MGITVTLNFAHCIGSSVSFSNIHYIILNIYSWSSYVYYYRELKHN